MIEATKSSAEQILNRMKEAAGISSDASLARMLGLTRQAIANAKKNGKIPDAWLIKAAEKFNTSASWLKNGDGAICDTIYTPEFLETLYGDEAKNSDYAEISNCIKKFYAPSLLHKVPTDLANVDDIEPLFDEFKQKYNDFHNHITSVLAQNLIALKKRLEREESERRKLSEENRNLWRKNAELYEQIIELEKRLNGSDIHNS